MNISLKNGICTIKIPKWEDFISFLHKNIVRPTQGLIWRGQRRAEWGLIPSLDRITPNGDVGFRKAIYEFHLNNFKYASRGRTLINPQFINNEDEWWALGQHYGLATPLLDWSLSPYVAAYFAFVEPDPDANYRAIYSLNRDKIQNENPCGNEVKFINPLTDYNSRIVNQSGLFTQTSIYFNLEDWIKETFNELNDTPILTKILIPNSERFSCLDSLNLMNINHLTLFPDLHGAAIQCNSKLERIY